MSNPSVLPPVVSLSLAGKKMGSYRGSYCTVHCIMLISARISVYLVAGGSSAHFVDIFVKNFYSLTSPCKMLTR